MRGAATKGETANWGGKRGKRVKREGLAVDPCEALRRRNRRYEGDRAGHLPARHDGPASATVWRRGTASEKRTRTGGRAGYQAAKGPE
ncbi:hypothetical protein FGB62_564g03 [Gracilaria domingensis]|nr:hypothetical protein FGB62_564g03 [Gracilaria domingensis]